jgi:hypothetical protein
MEKERLPRSSGAKMPSLAYCRVFTGEQVGPHSFGATDLMALKNVSHDLSSRRHMGNVTNYDARTPEYIVHECIVVKEED